MPTKSPVDKPDLQANAFVLTLKAQYAKLQTKVGKIEAENFSLKGELATTKKELQKCLNKPHVNVSIKNPIDALRYE